jgi:hypothetical protein
MDARKPRQQAIADAVEIYQKFIITILILFLYVGVSQQELLKQLKRAAILSNTRWSYQDMSDFSVQGSRFTGLAAYSTVNPNLNNAVSTPSQKAAPSPTSDQVSLSPEAMALFTLSEKPQPVTPSNGDGFRPPLTAMMGSSTNDTVVTPQNGDGFRPPLTAMIGSSTNDTVVTPQNGDGFRPPQDPPVVEE